MKQNKETGMIDMLFPYFASGIHVKQKVVVIEIPESKSKASMARNTSFEEN